MSYELGVDLGTTYTAAAHVRDGKAEIVPLGNRSPVVPSVLLLGTDGSVLAGEAAARRALTEPGRVAREFKRRLGDPLPVLVGGQPYSAEALSSRLLRWVVDQVSSLEGGPPRRVAVTHPANWGAYKKDLLAQAARMAEVHDVVFLTEPEAAAIHYASQERVEPGAVVAVYDLGGGTFDASVLRKTATGFELLGQPEGIERLGGIDFDQAVFAQVAGALGGELEALDRNDPAVISAVARLRQECTEAKETLSTDTEASVLVALPGLHTEVRVTRPEVEALLRAPLADSIGALRRALRSAGVEPGDLATVLLVGGSSRIPMVAEMVAAELGRPVAVDAHPKYAIALGAALFAAGSVGEQARASAAAEPVATASASALEAPLREPVDDAAPFVRAAPAPEPPAPAPAAAPRQPAPAPAAPTQPVAAPPPAPAAAAAAAVAAAPTPQPAPAPTPGPASPASPPGGAPWGPAPAPTSTPVTHQPAAPVPPKRRSTGLIVAAVVVLVLIAAVIVGAVVARSGGGASAATITQASLSNGQLVAQFDAPAGSTEQLVFFIQDGTSAQRWSWSAGNPPFRQSNPSGVRTGQILCVELASSPGSLSCQQIG